MFYTIGLTVSSSQTVLEPVRDVIALNRRANVEVLPFVETPLKVTSDVLRQLPKEHPEQSTKQRTREVEPLLPKVVPVVLVGPS